MSVFVGLDCGGSSSRVLAVDDTGRVLFQGQSGAANLVSTPVHRLRRNLMNAVRDCPAPSHVCGCFAGLIGEEQRRAAEEHLFELFPRARLRAEPDYTAALYASPEGTDVCVIAGTGSLVSSKGPSGIVKSGGRGYVLGDYGSGFHYGRDALVHFLDHSDRASNNLKSQVFEVFGSLDEPTIVAKVYQVSPPATLLAKLLKAFGHDAKCGEEYAIASIRRNTSLLVQVIGSHVQKHLADRSSIALSVAGGVWKAGPPFQMELEQQLAATMPEIAWTVARIVRPPVSGAVELAKEMVNGN